MTSQSVAYGSLLEEVRHNKVGEVENSRHNRVTEVETNRHNVTTEIETNRHNVATESIQREANAITKAHYERADAISLGNLEEGKRHNLVSESIAVGNLAVSQGQLAVAWSQYDLASQRRIDDWNIATRQFAYVDYPKAITQTSLWDAQRSLAQANAEQTAQETAISRVSAPYNIALVYAQASNQLSQTTLNTARTLESYTNSLSNVVDISSSVFGKTKKLNSVK